MTALSPLQSVQEDTTLLRSVFGRFPTGVTAVCAEVDGAPVGMAASSFTSVSLSPPLVSVCVQNSSQTWPVLRRARRIGVSVLSEEHEPRARTCRRGRETASQASTGSAARIRRSSSTARAPC